MVLSSSTTFDNHRELYFYHQNCFKIILSFGMVKQLRIQHEPTQNDLGTVEAYVVTWTILTSFDSQVIHSR